MPGDRFAHSYRQDYFQRLRPRAVALLAMAPLSLLAAAFLDSRLTGTPLLAGARPAVLLAGTLAMGLLMFAMARVSNIRLHAWVSIALLCAVELSLAFIVTPTPAAVQRFMPLLLAIPLAAAPFWIWRHRVLASCVLCYACASLALYRAGADRAALLAFAGQGALFTCIALAVCHCNDRMRRKAHELQMRLDFEARHDALTGLLSRRRFLEQAEAASHEAVSRGVAVSVCFLDLDHFKQINDQYGHAAGDRALSRVAECMLAQIPGNALLARMGGEEFVLLLPACTSADAREFAEHLRLAIRGKDMGGFGLSVSAGVAEHRPGESLGQTLHRADVALRDAKQHGRDRVEVAPA